MHVWQGSEYGSGLLKLPCCGSRRCMQTFDIYQTDYTNHSKLSIPPLLWRHTWKYSTQDSESLTKVKENDQLFNLMFLMFLSFKPFNVQTIRNKNSCGAGYFCMHQTSDESVGVCTCDCIHEMKFLCYFEKDFNYF